MKMFIFLAITFSLTCEAYYKTIIIPEVLGADSSTINDISENRIVCGSYRIGNQHIPFIWSLINGFRDLRDELPENAEPVAINDLG